MGVSSYLSIAAIVGLSAFLYERSSVLSLFYYNSPSHLSQINTFTHNEIKFTNLRSCEDGLMLEDLGLVILACDPGREKWNSVMGVNFPGELEITGLYAYDYTDAKLPDSEALKKIEITNFPGLPDLRSVGIAYERSTSTLYVVSHAKEAGNRIETFTLDLDKLVAKHKGTITHPLLHAPNSIAPINANEFYVTNDHYFTARQNNYLSHIETYLSLPFGELIHVKLEDGKVHPTSLARIPFANGVEILNRTTLAVSSTSSAAVHLYNRHEDGSLTLHSKIRLPFLPDNLSLSNGKLLIAGHPYAPGVSKFSVTRAICNYPEEYAKASDEMKDFCNNGKVPSGVAEWSEEGGLKLLYFNTEYPTSTTALKDAKRGVGVVTGLYANGILVWRD